MKKIKLDENFPPSFLSLFQSEIIDASSVHAQNISGTDDDNLYKICWQERRTLVTFDLDFANIIRYPADRTAGIIVCRLRKKTSLESIEKLCKTLVRIISENELSGKLFIVEEGKMRIRKPDSDF
jgi:predicted nuclease of predicted toxin-antitoxin system